MRKVSHDKKNHENKRKYHFPPYSFSKHGQNLYFNFHDQKLKCKEMIMVKTWWNQDPFHDKVMIPTWFHIHSYIPSGKLT